MAQEGLFEPKATKEQTRESVTKYRLRPELWDGNEKEIENLKRHAEHHRIPFSRSNQHQDSFLSGVLKNYGRGVMEGYTANIAQFDDQPDTVSEKVARQLGSLSGFLGKLPGGKFSKTIRAINAVTAGRSLPLAGANAVTKFVSKTGKPIIRDMPNVRKLFQEENLAGDVLKGAFHLGTASAISDWRGVVDEGMPRLIDAFKQGGIWGGGFRAIGNMKGFGKRLQPHQVDSGTMMPIMSKLEPGQKFDAILKAGTMGAIQGGYATSLDLPLEEQVYEYVMGAYFGFNETPLQLRISKKAIAETISKKYEDPTGLPDPEMHPKWDTWTNEAQKYIKRDFKEFFGEKEDVRRATYKLYKRSLANGGVNEKDIIEEMESMVAKNLEGTEFAPDGKVIKPISKGDIKRVQDIIKDNPNKEEYQDLDMHINEISKLPGKISGQGGFVDRYIMPNIDGGNTADRLVESLKINKQWDSLHQIVKGVNMPRKGAVDVMYDYLKKEYKRTELSQPEMDWWRNWAEQTRKKKLVLQTYFADGKVAYVDKGVNILGNKKELVFEPPLMEQVYQQLGGEGNFYAISDHFVRKGKEYKLNDVNKLQDDLYREKGGRKKKAENIIKQIKTKMLIEMDKEGYHYVGGRGDKKAMYFVKKNPQVRGSVQENMLQIKKAFVDAGMDAERFDNLRNYSKRQFWSKNRTLRQDYYDEAFISNIHYDVYNNFGATVKDFNKALVQMLSNKGYVSDSKAYNKRAQIWFNTGMSTNDVVARKYLKKYAKRYKEQIEALDFFGSDGNLRARGQFWNDDVKNSKSKKVLRKNSERPESFDGGIPALPEFVYALNKANGITNEGAVNKSFIVSPNGRHGALLGKYMFFEATPEMAASMRKDGIHFIAPKSAIKQFGTRRYGDVVEAGIKDGYTKQDFENEVNAMGLKHKRHPSDPDRIGEVFIPTDLQRQGYGTRFLKAFERYRANEGATQVKINAIGGRKDLGSFDLDNVNFWKKQGFKVDTKELERMKKAGIDVQKIKTSFNPKAIDKTVGVVPMVKSIKPKDQARMRFEGPTYDIRLDNIRTVLSEVTGNRDMDGAKFAKQLWSTITHFGIKPTDPKLVKLMSDELIRNSVEGDNDLNAQWDEHIKAPNKVSEAKVLENLDEISLQRLMNAVVDKDNEGFASKIYDGILKKSNEIEAQKAEDSETNRDDYFSAAGEISEFDTIVDRMSELYPDGNLGFYMHKMAKNYRQQAVKNYIVDRISRPKLKNGMKSRMRPWDHSMWSHKKFSIFDDSDGKGQEVFFLDDGAKQKKIYDPFFDKGYETLGNIWKNRKLGDKGIYKDNLDYVDDILEAVNMRVPMDSQSGAHVLKFAGFTGTKGHGVLLHGRVMDALGGADLDGDKAFIFFGGKKGMHKEWKDIWRGQRDEFIDKDGNEIAAKSDLARAMFVKSDKIVEDFGQSRFSKYDPYWRGFMSEAAGDGRDTLGGAVTTRQSLASAYDAMRFSDKADVQGKVMYIDGMYLPSILRKGSYYYPVDKMKNGRVIYMKQTPKQRGAVETFKELSRAAINLGADPMDESGIVSPDIIKNILTDTLFKFEYVTGRQVGTKSNKKWIFGDSFGYYKGKNNDKARELIAKDKVKGFHSIYGRLNNTLYGRNFQTGRKYSYGEIQSSVQDIDWLPESAKQNLVGYIAKEYRNIPYEDNVFRRLDRTALDDLYNSNRRDFADNPDLLALFERTSMMTRRGPLIDNILNHEIYDADARLALAHNKKKFWDLFSRKWHPQFDEQVKGDKRYKMGNVPAHLWYKFVKNREATSVNDRLQYLEYKLNQAEDFITNDLSDMSSIRHILNIKKQYKISDTQFKKVNAMVNELKMNSYYVKKANRELREDVRELGNKFKGDFDSERFLKMIGFRKKSGAGMDQQAVDRQILFDKKQLKLQGLQNLYDSLLLGTFQKTNLDLIKKYETQKKPLTPSERALLQVLRKHGQNTALLRIGFQSKSVKDGSVKKHLDEYNRLYKQVAQPSAEEMKQVKDIGAGNESQRPPSYNDELGKMSEGKIIEASDLSEADRVYMDMIEPFKGLKKGSVKDKELYKTMLSIENHMKHYHNMDTRAFNGFFRSLFQKNINMATKFDLQNFDRILTDMRKGSTWVRFTNWVTGKNKEPLPDLEKRYWSRFPEANNKEWLKYPGMMKWEKDIAPFKDRFNNSIMGEVVRPTTIMGDLQNFSAKISEFSLQTSEEETNKLREELAPLIQSHADGPDLWKVAIPIRERAMVSLISEIEGGGSKMSHRQMHYIRNYEAVQPMLRKLKDKQYVIPTKDGAVKMSGMDVINKINEIITNKNKYMANFINGDSEYVKQFTKVAYNRQGQLTWAGVDLVAKKWMRYSKEKFRKGEKYDISKFGINGIMEISKLIQIKYTTPKRFRTKRLLKELSGQLGLGLQRTELWDPEAYFPHIAFDRTEVNKQLSRGLDAIFADKKKTKERKYKEAKKLIYQSHTMTGDWAPKSISEENFDVMQETYSKLSQEVDKKKPRAILPNTFKKAFSQNQRESHLGGWSTELEAFEANMKNTIDTFYKESMLSLSRMHIQEFHSKFLKQSKDKKLAARWSNFLKLFTQSSMGYPIDIPEAIQNDPKMKIKGTPYQWFADNNARKRIESIKEKLGISHKSLKKYGIKRSDVEGLQGMTQNQLQYWSGLEAKWQMASLLAHPKSALTNLFGGTIHTGIGAGVQNLKKARDIDYLRTNINPNWRSMRDVEKWVESLGIVEEFLMYEAGLNKEIRGKRMDSFLKAAMSKLRRNPNLSDTSLADLAKEYKVTDTMWNKASWFMRKPERILRRDAFMSHYIKARENFKGAIRDYDHPFLIEMGRKGVQATQFLYSAPFRPMWTNSALGRVMSRFQLWSWNSVRFRKDILSEVGQMGYQPGTAEFDRAKRLITADAMIYSLSSMFMYSLFDNALPAPWNWFQDTADAMFGDEEDRERAFFGHPAGPLSIIKPPVFRFDKPMWDGLVHGNWDKMTDYYLYTMLPFGRIIKDVVGPGGYIDNPFYAVEKFTGVPYIGMGDYLQDVKKGKNVGKGLFSDLY